MNAIATETYAPPNGDYRLFLERKSQAGADAGFDPVFMPDYLFDFQKALVEWAVTQGRSAIFADCGMGKTPMQLVWAQNVVQETNGQVLILAPLAVAGQTAREAEKFGIKCHVNRTGGCPRSKITVTNYEQLDKFDANDFAGVVCDESSILKSFDGATRNEVTHFMRKVPYRLLATATAAPNDYVELGTSSECLGCLGHMDMLNRFFKNDNNNSSSRRMYGEAPKWRFKGHAEKPFWRWVCSWARALRRPSDLGFDDEAFILPELIERVQLVAPRSLPDGVLFSMSAATLPEQREERRRTVKERCERVAELVDHGQPAIVWCHLNDEGNLLAKLIPDAVQVSGSDKPEVKEERLLDFANGKTRVLITKPKIGAWGLNFQHCAHVVAFPSHSYEQYYQAVRRCWRFGQKRPVVVDVVTTDGEKPVLDNLQRKSVQADRMFGSLVEHMNEALGVSRVREFNEQEEIPSWL